MSQADPRRPGPLRNHRHAPLLRDMRGEENPPKLQTAELERTDMEIKADVLERKIEAIPGVCDDGKKAIKELFAEAFGVEFKNTLIPKNAVYRNKQDGFTFYVATVGGPDVYHLVAIDEDHHTGTDSRLQDLGKYLKGYKKIANSLQEYFRLKFDGKL